MMVDLMCNQIKKGLVSFMLEKARQAVGTSCNFHNLSFVLAKTSINQIIENVLELSSVL